MILYKTKDSKTVRVNGGDRSHEGCLQKTNTTPFTPTDDYNPATKKYVDDLVGGIAEILDAINRKPTENNSDKDEIPFISDLNIFINNSNIIANCSPVCYNSNSATFTFTFPNFSDFDKENQYIKSLYIYYNTTPTVSDSSYVSYYRLSPFVIDNIATIIGNMVEVTELTNKTTYYFRAYIVYDDYYNEKKFLSKGSNIVSITTSEECSLFLKDNAVPNGTLCYLTDINHPLENPQCHILKSDSNLDNDGNGILIYYGFGYSELIAKKYSNIELVYTLETNLPLKDDIITMSLGNIPIFSSEEFKNSTEYTSLVTHFTSESFAAYMKDKDLGDGCLRIHVSIPKGYYFNFEVIRLSLH
ncbi:hypothetical protein D7V86_03405 [bacterium D16-51]|nr:hypothetical protein D7V96_00515 [bacterium D16-59]RKI61855.1 hypothetical protein D7V86_03405 [bacterium D16-51]